MPFRVPMTVRVVAIESCSATHLLSVSRKRSRRSIELLREDPQGPLRVGLQFTLKTTGLTIQVAAVGQILRYAPNLPQSKALACEGRWKQYSRKLKVTI
jgi:hypothetical protein